MELVDKQKSNISVKLDKNHKSFPLIVHGQGVFVFRNTDLSKDKCQFTITDRNKMDGFIIVFDFEASSVNVLKLSSAQKCIGATTELIKEKNVNYWFSLDSQNQKLYAGVGEARIETIVYSFVFPNNQKNKIFLESLDTVTIETDNIDPVKLIRDPITNFVPLLVKCTNSLTMNDIASGKFLPKANLSMIGQQLYDCVSGVNFVLDAPDFPEFSKAIEYSIRTPGQWCHERLKNKANEFNKDKPNLQETYLRITLGMNNGESPGIPYVMEVWPVGHYSPVHNHAGANAIIRVLHGNINVSLYPFLHDKIKSFAEVNFKKDDITWISPNLNQTHRLKNLEKNKETCITIQCYWYDEDNKSHYDYFDYLDSNGGVKQYEPDSDMDFLEFKKLILEEWINYKNCVKCVNIIC